MRSCSVPAAFMTATGKGLGVEDGHSSLLNFTLEGGEKQLDCGFSSQNLCSVVVKEWQTGTAELLKRSDLQPGAELSSKVDRWGDDEDFDSNFFFYKIALACRKFVLASMFLFPPPVSFLSGVEGKGVIGEIPLSSSGFGISPIAFPK
ncbi:hypothetical protein CDAR_543771 [Caerostris darwini]|uniref:Uncharacterized protein n=1 Tax=Caerostris darwini TaxID=1538125 RepID=A0AAV4NLD0_9ARAC|nr:hypothetical protein CDAR_543771 [Caerostris darwini]